MGKRRWPIGMILLTAALHATPVWASAQIPGTAASEDTAEPEKAVVSMNGERRIEQVYLNLPEVCVYGEGFTPADVEEGEGYLSQDKLEFVSAKPFSETGEGIFCYVMLDISGSIPGEYFRSIKEGIQNLQDRLGEKDGLALCVFGEEVTLAADGSQTSDEMAEILAGLKNKDQETLLFEGIDRVADLADQTREICHRQVILVVSDGEDFATGRKMSGEALAALRDKGLPAYAVCIQGTAKENINSFGEFARMSGGTLRTFQPEEGADVLTEITAGLKEHICVRYRTASNVVTNKEENFNFQFPDGSVLSRAVMNVHWIPDHEAPRLVSGDPVGDRQIRLTFSEPMTGLAGAANYKVRMGDQEIGVTGVAYDEDDETRIVLTLADGVKNGNYEVICANLTDDSMEKNPLEGSILVNISGIQEEETAGDNTINIRVDEANRFDYTGILFLLLVAVVALTVFLAVLNSKKRKAVQIQSKGENHNPDISRTDPAENGFKSHVVMGEKRTLNVIISAKGRQSRQVIWELGSSLIVGRAALCDVTVDDIEMSRQHFCLEWEDEGIVVTDLGSTNGTAINGIRIRNRRRLEPGDYIEAGSMKFTIRW